MFFKIVNFLKNIIVDKKEDIVSDELNDKLS